MGLHQVLGLQSCHPLQSVNVLGVAAQKQSLLLQQADEVVADGWLELPGIELLGKGKEGFWMFLEVTDLKDGFRVREVVLLQVRIEASGW